MKPEQVLRSSGGSFLQLMVLFMSHPSLQPQGKNDCSSSTHSMRSSPLSPKAAQQHYIGSEWTTCLMPAHTLEQFGVTGTRYVLARHVFCTDAFSEPIILYPASGNWCLCCCLHSIITVRSC